MSPVPCRDPLAVSRFGVVLARPWLVLWSSVAVVLLSCVGLGQTTVISDSEDVWLPQNTQVLGGLRRGD